MLPNILIGFSTQTASLLNNYERNKPVTKVQIALEKRFGLVKKQAQISTERLLAY